MKNNSKQRQSVTWHIPSLRISGIQSLRWLILPPFILILLSACAEPTDNSDKAASNTTQNIPVSARASENRSIKVSADMSIISISEKLYRQQPAIAIDFSARLDPLVSYNNLINVSNKKGRKVRGGWILSENKKILYFTNIRPRETYEVMVSAGLMGKNNTRLVFSKGYKLTTKNLPPVVGFSGRGMIIPAGKALGIPVRAVNVKDINVDFYKVSPDKFSMLLTDLETASSTGDWQISQITNGLEAISSKRYELENTLNKTIENKLPLPEKIRQTPAIYFAVMTRQGIFDYNKAITYFTVSDIAMHVRIYKEQYHLFTSHVRDGQLMAEVKFKLLNRNGELLFAGTTNSQGEAIFPQNKKAALLLANKGEHLALISLNSPAMDLSDFVLPKRGFSKREFFIYGPRDLYRPGEKLQFSLLLRDFDGELLPAMPINFQLLRPDGVIAHSGKLAPQPLGYYDYQYQLPQDAPTGKWSIEVKIKGDSEFVKKSILIEDFLPEKIKVSFSRKNKTMIEPNKEIVVEVSGDYLYGAPAAGNRLLSEVRIREARSPFKQWQNFRFGEKQNYDRNWYLKDLKLDKKGKASLTLPDDTLESMHKVKGPVRLDFRASVLESGGRAVERALTIYQWRGGYWPGIRAEFNPEKNQLVNKKAHFKLLTSNEKGEALAGRLLRVTLINLNRQSYWEYDRNSGWRYEHTENPFNALQQQYRSKNQPIDISLPVEKGYYRLLVEDEQGNQSTYNFRIGANWWSYNQNENRAPKPDKIEIILDRPAYNPGDVAHVKLQTPRPGAGFILVENSERVLWSKRISARKKSMIVDIPIATDWRRHDLRIVALIAQPEAQVRKGLPMRALGLQALPLKRTKRQLKLSIVAPEKIEPQTVLKVKLKLAKAPKSKVMVSLAVVDQGVLSVTNFKTPQPWDYFFANLNPYVDAKDNYDNILHLNNLDYAKLRSGGDAASLNRGGDKPASEVNIVALFHRPVEFDDKGEAQINLLIPDFNGAVRLMAVAFSEDSYADAAANVIVSAPIITQLSTARFAAMGDITQLTLDLQNALKTTQNLTIKWQITGAELRNIKDEISQVTLAKNEKTILQIPLLITQVTGQAVIKLNVKNDVSQQTNIEQSRKINFNRVWKLGLRPAYAARTQQALQYIKPGETLEANEKWFAGALPRTLQLQWVVDDKPPLNTKAQWQYLLQYPYGCLEQTTSRAWPLALANKQIQKKWQLSLPKELQRYETVNSAIGRLQTMQKSSGGFGLWRSQSREEKWLTVYVTDFLISAKDLGFEVPQIMLERAEKRLLSYVRNNRLELVQSYYADPAHFRFAYRTYAAYVLARIGKAPLGTLRQWMKTKTQNAKSPLPLVHLAIALKLQGDIEKSKQALRLAKKVHRDERKYLADYGSFIRDEAMILTLNLQYKLSLSDANKRLFELSKKIYEKTYLSTQERDAIFQLSLALDQGEGIWQASFSVANKEKKISGPGRWSKVIKGKTAVETLLKVAGQKNVFVAQTLVSHSQKAPPAISAGIEIERHWFNPDGSKIVDSNNKKTTVKTGDFVVVQLLIKSDKRLPDGLLVDLLPAGFELENPALVHSTPLEKFVINGQPLKFVNTAYEDRIKHKEYRDDRLMMAVDFSPYTTLEVFYVMRAVTPGVYQVPSTYAEDMYRPEIRGIGSQRNAVTIIPR